MWNQVGFALALIIAALAAWRSRAGGGYYDRDVYAMTPRVHRGYALVSLAFALFFAGAWRLRAGVEGLAGLAVYAAIVIFYCASFVRGAQDDEGESQG